MSRESIQQQRKFAEDAIREAEARLHSARAELEAVRIRCTHPSAVEHQGSHMGELCRCWKCPDCGKETHT